MKGFVLQVLKGRDMYNNAFLCCILGRLRERKLYDGGNEHSIIMNSLLEAPLQYHDCFPFSNRFRNGEAITSNFR